MRKLYLFFSLSLFVGCNIYGQSSHPHIFVSDTEKSAILEKIQKQSWAQMIYQEMVDEVRPYVNRHQEDPQWILSRYQMNWKEGAHYTHFYSDPSGTRLIGKSGNAPFPTVKVTTHKRNPIAPDGYYYRRPTLEEIIPNDTASEWRLQSTGPEAAWSYTDPRQFIGSVNGSINELALESAILYWLTGEEKYGRFTADILFQWSRGAYYQNPVKGACRNGFLDMQSLGDRRYDELILAYDFVHDFMFANNYEMKYFQEVFQKMANTAMIRGFWANNWYAAQSTTMVYAALTLEDELLKNYYLSYFLEKDTINGSCGQLGLSSTTEKHLTHDGHWKENPGYHNMPVGDLLKSSTAVEKNGHSVFDKFPALFEASYALLKYSFPNLRIMGFGDIGSRRTQSPQNLEIAIRFAQKYQNPVLPALVEGLQQLIDQDLYQREQGGWLGLLTYLPELPEKQISNFSWNRGMEIDFARCYGQRNGIDPVHGMMYYVQGATYNHNNANGMAMELYGKGHVLGSESGTTSYEEPVFVNYYAVFGSHNTVIAAGASEPNRPFRGSGGAKAMGAIELSAMEPRAGKKALSPGVSFTTTKYLEPSTQTNQQRTMALIRTGDTTGYYVDFFRSDNNISNTYLYHNLGQSVKLFDKKQRELPCKPAKLVFEKDKQTGLDWLKKVSTPTEKLREVIAKFEYQKKNETINMQVFTPLAEDEAIFTAYGPRTRIAPKDLYNLPTPAMIIHRSGTAWEKPFAAVFEPFIGEKGSTLKQVRRLPTTGNLAALRVYRSAGESELIIHSDQPDEVKVHDNFDLAGYLGIISLKKDKPAYFYLGAGQQLSYNGYQIRSKSLSNNVYVELNKKSIHVAAHEKATLTLPYRIRKIKNNSIGILEIKRSKQQTVLTIQGGQEFDFFIK